MLELSRGDIRKYAGAKRRLSVGCVYLRSEKAGEKFNFLPRFFFAIHWLGSGGFLFTEPGNMLYMYYLCSAARVCCCASAYSKSKC